MPALQQEHFEHPADVLAVVADRQARGEPVALAIATAIEGGSARPRGTLVAVDGTGRMFGYVSNGCIDADLAHQMREALDRQSVGSIRYGAGSPFMDLRLPCGGAIDLVIDPTPDREAVAVTLAALENRQAATLHVHPELGLLAPGEDRTRGDAIGFTYRPRARLSVAGRGAVLRAAAQQAHLLGMEIAVASPDKTDLDALSGLNPIQSLHLTRPEAGADLPFDTETAVLLLFHDHDWETAILTGALESDAPYIGALGSRETHAKRRVALMEAGIDPAQIARVRGPVGLVPSLRNASEIAVSALAEVIAAFRARRRAMGVDEAA